MSKELHQKVSHVIIELSGPRRAFEALPQNQSTVIYSWRNKGNKRTLLSPLLLGAVDVVFELNAHLPLVGLVSDERVLQELLCWRPLCVVLHQTALNKTEKLFGPVQVVKEKQRNQISSSLRYWGLSQGITITSSK